MSPRPFRTPLVARYSTFLLAILTASLVTAWLPAARAQQQAAQASPQAAPKKARIEGRVVSSTGQGVPRATIRLQRGVLDLNQALLSGGQLPPVTSATSDDAGNFVFADLDPGRDFRLSAQRTGFIVTNYGARSFNGPAVGFTLEAGATRKDIVITMTPQGVITGKITDQHGDPLLGVQVRAVRRAYQRGVRIMQQASTSSTNDQGEYRLPNLIPGRYYVSATDRQIPLNINNGVPVSATVANIPTFYPNASDLNGAAPIELMAGAEMRAIDIRLQTGKLFNVRGKAVNALTGAAANPVVVRVLRKEDGRVQGGSGFIDEGVSRSGDGSFEARSLSPGTYTVQYDPSVTLSVNPGGVPLPKLVGRIEIIVRDSDVTGIVLPLTSGVVVTGKVALEGGDIKTIFPPSAPPAGGQPGQAAGANPPPLALSVGRATILLLSPMSLALADGATAASGPLNEDGTIKLEALFSGKYAVDLRPLGSAYYVKSVSFGGADVTHKGFDLSPAGGGTLQIVVSDKAATVSGAVANAKGEPQANVLVTLWSKEPEPGIASRGFRSAYTDQSGAFQLQGLAPGEYNAAAWEDVDPGLAESRDFLGQFLGSAQKIKLGESDQGSAQLKLIPSDAIQAAIAKLP